jgi:hypothetical protein
MAKYVICTELNSQNEEARHPNSTTRSTRVALQKRRRQFKTTVDPNRFCKLHGDKDIPGTASPSGMFKDGHVDLPIPFSTKKYESDALSGKNEPIPDDVVALFRPKKKVKKVKSL